MTHVRIRENLNHRERGGNLEWEMWELLMQTYRDKHHLLLEEDSWNPLPLSTCELISNKILCLVSYYYKLSNLPYPSLHAKHTSTSAPNTAITTDMV